MFAIILTFIILRNYLVVRCSSNCFSSSILLKRSLFSVEFVLAGYLVLNLILLTMARADIGMIGLAVMGQNLVLNMNDHGFTVNIDFSAHSLPLRSQSITELFPKLKNLLKMKLREQISLEQCH